MKVMREMFKELREAYKFSTVYLLKDILFLVFLSGAFALILYVSSI